MKQIPKYAHCIIKNIAVLNKYDPHYVLVSNHIKLINVLPDNCIRLHSSDGWCYNSKGGVCRECKYRVQT